MKYTQSYIKKEKPKQRVINKQKGLIAKLEIGKEFPFDDVNFTLFSVNSQNVDGKEIRTYFDWLNNVYYFESTSQYQTVNKLIFRGMKNDKTWVRGINK